MKAMPEVGQSVWYLGRNGPKRIRVIWTGGRCLEGRLDSGHVTGQMLSEVFRTRKECVMARVREHLQEVRCLERDIERGRVRIDRLLEMMGD